MLALYVCSAAVASGKTTICVGLAQRLAADGFAVAYLKPVDASPPTPQPGVSPDALFVRQALGLRLPVETVAPIHLARPSDDAPERLRGAFAAASLGRDVVLLEGAPDLQVGAALGLSGPEVRALLNARALVVARYAPDGLAESILAAREALGGDVLGAVVNAVPEVGWRQVERRVRSALEAAGVPLLGVLPVVEELLGLTVGELAAALGGEFLCAADQADRQVDAYMVAAMSDLGADEYFRRHARKAVIASGDHPDVHLPALQTDTACIVLTNGLDPDPTVLALARDQEVPLVKVRQDTFAALDAVSDLLPSVRFRQRYKVPIAARLIAEHFDYPALRRAVSEEAAR